MRSTDAIALHLHKPTLEPHVVFPFLIIGKTGLLGISQYYQNLQFRLLRREGNKECPLVFISIIFIMLYSMRLFVCFLNEHFLQNFSIYFAKFPTCSADIYWMNPRYIFWGLRAKEKSQIPALIMFIAHKYRAINNK